MSLIYLEAVCNTFTWTGRGREELQATMGAVCVWGVLRCQDTRRAGVGVFSVGDWCVPACCCGVCVFLCVLVLKYYSFVLRFGRTNNTMK